MTEAAGASQTHRIAPVQIERTDRPDGGVVLRNAALLPDPLPDILDRFRQFAAANANATLVSEPAGEADTLLSYGDADRLSARMAAALVARGLGSGDRVAVLAGASNNHAALKIACLKAGLVHVPLSPHLTGSDFGRRKLADFLAIARPALVVGEDGILAGADLGSVDTVDWAALDGHAEIAESDHRSDHSPDDPAAIYFTSGSTGAPKGVIVTRRMIASCQAAYALHYPYLTRRPPVLIDWLPWHHVFGGLDNFFKMVWNGGAYHIDTPPDPTRVDEMAARIRAFPPSLHINVPYGLALLVDRLSADAETRAAFFSRLEAIFFAGAAIDAEAWARLHATVAAGPHGPHGAPAVLSGYGSTEAGSTICVAHEPPGQPGEVGLPLAGHDLLMAPVDGALECRFRGPNISPGYLTADGPAPVPLDDEGFLCTGDLVAALHEGAPERGLRFDGRIAEDFKLTTGTRVKVGALRHLLLEACAPHVADVAIAGEGKARLGAILFPRPDAGNDLAALRDEIATALAAHNQQHPGLSTAIARAALADSPADPDAGEINDKGHLVQRRTLKNRAGQVDALFAPSPPAGVIDLAHSADPERKEVHV